MDLENLAQHIKQWGKSLGFQQVGISDIDLSIHEKRLNNWLSKNYHGEMAFMEAHGRKRSNPQQLVPETLRVISVRLDYLPPDASFAKDLADANTAYISRYALGRDYHKVLRHKLKKLGEKIKTEVGEHVIFRPFVDSAPVLEHAIAEKAGIGWTGKHSLTLHQDAGSWFFLGELFINLPLPVDKPITEQCGNCVACITICPTKAIVEPYVVDARRCISYLTIELDGPIPEEFRKAIGNRIYGCDDCQLVCPWNRYAQLSEEPDFAPRKQLKGKTLLELFSWDESMFLENTAGTAIRRIGYEKWQRNLAIGLGNAAYDQAIIDRLEEKLSNSSALVSEHIEWALLQQKNKQQEKQKQDKQNQASEDRDKLRLVRVIEKGLPRDA